MIPTSKQPWALGSSASGAVVVNDASMVPIAAFYGGTALADACLALKAIRLMRVAAVAHATEPWERKTN